MLRNIISLLIGGAVSFATAFAQPDTLWTQTYGGSGEERGMSVQQTTDGGYVITGWTNSYGSGSDDVYLVKTDMNGNEEWTRTFGGSSPDYGYCVQQTTDEGYIIAGTTFSGFDIYLIKTDSSGNQIWSHTFTGGYYSDGKSVQQTTDGGYVIVGQTLPYDSLYYDVYLIKTDASGNQTWSQTFGGNHNDGGFCVQQTSDGGYIIVGFQYYANLLYSDVYLIKTDGSGNLVWSQTFGESMTGEFGRSVQQTNDGGYIIVGTTSGMDSDVYLIKTDELGNQLWSQIFDGGEDDIGRSVQQTSDEGYIIAGYTTSYGAGIYDVYLIKTDEIGNQTWAQTFGGSNYDQGYSVQQTQDGGYIVAGFTESFGAGWYDVYLIRLEPDSTYPNVTITIEPINPPIIIPATGGTFEYELVLENLTAQTHSVDVWIDVALPNGTVYGPLALRQDFEMLPGFSLTRTLSQYVPLPAPEGQYTMNAYVGDYNLNEVWCEDHFTFMKVCDGGESIDYLPEPDGFNLTASEVTTTHQPGEIEIDNHPNPFNPTTVLSYKLQVASFVNLSVYDVAGRQVADLVDGWRDAGSHQVTFDGTNLASGIYLYTLTAGKYTASGKMVLMK